MGGALHYAFEQASGTPAYSHTLLMALGNTSLTPFVLCLWLVLCRRVQATARQQSSTFFTHTYLLPVAGVSRFLLFMCAAGGYRPQPVGGPTLECVVHEFDQCRHCCGICCGQRLL
jgi:hypothetical protein